MHAHSKHIATNGAPAADRFDFRAETDRSEVALLLPAIQAAREAAPGDGAAGSIAGAHAPAFEGATGFSPLDRIESHDLDTLSDHDDGLSFGAGSDFF